MAFLDVAFPLDVAAGVVGGPERRTDVVSLGSGREERNARWFASRRRFDAGLGVRSADDLAAVVALFEQANGRLHSFRFRDWSDHKSCLPSGTPAPTDCPLGTGDGARLAFPLRKSYGGAPAYLRAVTKPVAGSVRVALGGAEVSAGWAIDHLTGVVAFAAPPAPGVPVSAGFLFDVPVRFDADRLDVDLAFFTSADPARGVGSIPAIGLQEVDE